MSPEQILAREIIKAIVETIDEAPDGAPGGHIYAALMHIGVSFKQFESLMAVLIKTGRVTKQGHCYYRAH